MVVSLFLSSAFVADAAAQRLEPVRTVTLPGQLTEVSGLALAGPMAVLAHDDERGRVWRIDLGNGQIARAFDFGEKLVRADFEGIERASDFTYLVTSEGLLFEARHTDGAEELRYNVYDTMPPPDCEIEGLTSGGEDGLLLLCKRTEGRLRVLRWSLAERLRPAAAWLDLRLAEVRSMTAGEATEVQWSGLVRDQGTGHFFVLASKGGWILELDPLGALVGTARLDERLHPQAEGIAILSDGTFVIADEGGRSAGKLTIYRPPR